NGKGNNNANAEVEVAEEEEMFPEIPELPRQPQKWTEKCLEMWQILHDFVSQYVLFFYPDATNLTQDRVLMDAWLGCPRTRDVDLDRDMLVDIVTEFLFDSIVTKNYILKHLHECIVQYHEQNHANVWNLSVGDHSKREYLNMYCILGIIQAQLSYFHNVSEDFISQITAPILRYYV
ncbi:hypothetical protein RFI_12737, partial [Reticulomyxa filosa]